MKSQTPFAEFIDVINKIPPEKKMELVESHKKFGELRTFCEAKGYIKTMERLEGITVIKNTKEVRELKKVIDILQPGKFKWEDETKKSKKIDKE